MHLIHRVPQMYARLSQRASLQSVTKSRRPLSNPRYLLQSHYSSTPTRPVEYDYLEGVENLYRYCEGGYHPICINDRLEERYRIANKLGYGSYSTVWLAIDDRTSRYVAVKVGTADASCTEEETLCRLTAAFANNGSSEDQLSPIPVILDRFDIHGPNGTHPCLVTHPARCSLLDAKEASDCDLFQLDTARSLIAQLAQALSFVHSQGYIHGDLHLGNLLLSSSSSLDSMSIDQLYSQYGQPHEQPVTRLDTQATEIARNDPGVPRYVVSPVSLGKASHKIALSEANLMLSDFGVAFQPTEKFRFKSYMPIVLCPPEAFFEPTTALTYASDVWSLGCVIFELLAHRSLIDGFFTPDDEIIAQQVQLQGIMPLEWWRNWEKRPEWYDEAGKPLSNPSDLWSWERRFYEWVQFPRRLNDMETISGEERDALFELLKWMLSWKPDQRPDMKTVMKTGWMTRWALPTYQKGLEERAG